MNKVSGRPAALGGAFTDIASEKEFVEKKYYAAPVSCASKILICAVLRANPAGAMLVARDALCHPPSLPPSPLCRQPLP